MTEREYRAHPAVNKSTLWELRKSPAHYRHALSAPTDDTPALLFGRMVHKLLLQPDDFNAEFAVAPDVNRRTKAGQEEWAAFMAANEGLSIVTADEYLTACTMANVVRSVPAARPLLEQLTPELPLFWRDDITGIECKCRCDLIGPGIVVDYKTCDDASTEAFTRKALSYGYDLQAAMYSSGATANGYGDTIDWIFIAQEQKPPYAVNVIRAGDAFLERGFWRMNALLEKYAVAKAADFWPSYNETAEPNEIILPEWAVIPED